MHKIVQLNVAVNVQEVACLPISGFVKLVTQHVARQKHALLTMAIGVQVVIVGMNHNLPSATGIADASKETAAQLPAAVPAGAAGAPATAAMILMLFIKYAR